MFHTPSLVCFEICTITLPLHRSRDLLKPLFRNEYMFMSRRVTLFSYAPGQNISHTHAPTHTRTRFAEVHVKSYNNLHGAFIHIYIYIYTKSNYHDI